MKESYSCPPPQLPQRVFEKVNEQEENYALTLNSTGEEWNKEE